MRIPEYSSSSRMTSREGVTIKIDAVAQLDREDIAYPGNNVFEIVRHICRLNVNVLGRLPHSERSQEYAP